MLGFVFKLKIKNFLIPAGILSIVGCTSLHDLKPSSEPTTISQDLRNALERLEDSSALSKTSASLDFDQLPIPQIDKKPPPLVDLWERTRRGFQLDLAAENRRIKVQRNWYAKHQEYINRVAKRASRYYYHVVNQVETRGMPAELALLPIVESAYDPFAYSHGRASGMWQFIPGTGKRYGLAQNWWYDGRRDIVASTDAALNYLDYLQKRFDGDWLLALAAYNSGEGNVSKAIKKNRRKNRATDFWSLDLPKETRAYVPKLIALAQLVKQPDRYGITLPPISNRPYFAQVETNSQIDLAQAAELADIPLEELYLLNPGYNQWATAPDGPHHLNIPIAKSELFKRNLAQLPPEKRISWIRYKIKSGDSLSTIAYKHRTTAKALRKINNLSSNRIRAGHVLFIPVASKSSEHYALSASQRLIAKQMSPAKSGKIKSIHQVKSGDSFWKISRQYGVGMRQLAAWNGLGTTDKLRVGQKLVVWTKPQLMATNATPAAGRQIIRQIGYRVRNGDSLARIAQKFNVRISDIEAWNGIHRSKYLQPGQPLKLYVDITRASL